jgi:hypothetical protein
MYILEYFCQKSGSSATLPAPPPFLSLVRHQSEYQSPVPGCGECGWWQVHSSPALSKGTIGATPIWASSRKRQTL